MLLHNGVFAHGAVGPQINPSWWTSLTYSMTCNKGCGMGYSVCADGAYKRTISANQKE